MPYFGELQGLLNDVSHWADLRHEQGHDVSAVVKRLRKELKHAAKTLRKSEPGSDTLKHEPDNLDRIRELRPGGPRVLWPELRTAGLANRMKGAWLGRAAGCTLGAPVEAWSIDAMEALAKRCGMAFPPTDYWSAHPAPEVVRYGKDTVGDYLKDNIRAVPVDDDLTYTLLGLLVLEEYGPDFITAQVGDAWLKYLPVACTAEAVALENLRQGVPALAAGAKRNPYQEWIGADIRSDPWGYAAPGWPEKAAALAYRDAYLSHRRNGIYGSMFFAASIAAAFAAGSVEEALAIGLTEIPAKCRLAKAVRWALDTAPDLDDWRKAREAVDQRFAGMHPVHTINNACLTVFGLVLGKQDFTRTIGLTVAMGLDNDCTAATAGSIVGAIVGKEGIPTHWYKNFNNTIHSYLIGRKKFSITGVLKRFQKQARKIHSQSC